VKETPLLPDRRNATESLRMAHRLVKFREAPPSAADTPSGDDARGRTTSGGGGGGDEPPAAEPQHAAREAHRAARIRLFAAAIGLDPAIEVMVHLERRRISARIRIAL
jgi:hypothetical protein